MTVTLLELASSTDSGRLTTTSTVDSESPMSSQATAPLRTCRAPGRNPDRHRHAAHQRPHSFGPQHEPHGQGQRLDGRAGVRASGEHRAHRSAAAVRLLRAPARSARSCRSRAPKSPRSRRPMSVAAEMLDTCREALSRTDIVPLNGAFTSPALYPNQRLNNLIREVLRDRPHHAGEMIMPPGDPELRRQVAKRMALAGAPTDPEHVVITSGAMDAITLALRVCASPAIPCWWNRPPTSVCCRRSSTCGLKVVEVPNRPGIGIDVEAVRNIARTTRLAAAVLMPNFNNPAGTLTPDDAKRDIVATLTGIEMPDHRGRHLRRPALRQRASDFDARLR